MPDVGHLWKGKTQRMTDSSWGNRWTGCNSEHKGNQKPRSDHSQNNPRLFQNTETCAPGLGKVGHSRWAPCGASGGTLLKVALYRTKWPLELRWVGRRVIKAFSQAILRAQHFSKHLLGCLDMAAKHFSSAWPLMPGAGSIRQLSVIYSIPAYSPGQGFQ